METCDPTSRNNDNKSPNGVGSGGGSAGGGSLPQVPQGKYSFIHKVVDGITIIVNTVNVKFLSTAFTASVQVRWIFLNCILMYVNKFYYLDITHMTFLHFI